MRINKTKLTQLKQLMGITCPLRIEWVHPWRMPSPLVAGCTHWDNHKHSIVLSRAIASASEGVRVLIHELQHCAQKEAIGDSFEADRRYHAHYAVDGYDRVPYEIEANRVAAALEGLFYDLVVDTSQAAV